MPLAATALLLLAALSGCFPYYGPADTTTDPADETGGTDSQLTSSHTGWRQPDCLQCHTRNSHNEGLLPYECATCHGTNGAPAGHGGDPPCSTCHGQPHGAENFPDPASCQGCHGS